MSESVEDEIAHLRGLEPAGLRARWRVVMGRAAPSHLPRHLLLRILAYRIQANAFGDLSPESIRYLQKLGGGGEAPLPSRATARAGTVLVREWEGVHHHVMSVEGGYAWNGKTFRSLSEVARAITGTRWNGPRFFGLREKKGAASSGSPEQPGRPGAAGKAARPAKAVPARMAEASP